jgi:hypothetical protein
MKFKKTATMAAAAAFALTGLNQAAFASTTLEVDGSTVIGDVLTNGTPKGSIDFETNYGVETSCATGGAVATVKRGASGGIGTHVGTINTMLFDNCLATGLLFEVEATQKGANANWTIHTTEVPAKGQRYVGVEIRNISAQLLDNKAPYNVPGMYRCALNVGGTVPGVIDTVKNSLIIDSPEVLEIDALNAWADKDDNTAFSCGGEVWDGDVASMTAEFNLDVDVEVV